ncbi:unnamed protein product [Clavelina lepadiformis]|uniref:Uncharacterized protein n=1 Tax=Clavelina lepadiformis TaxID=159417 RepID=A0ABP0GIA5_CLALP
MINSQKEAWNLLKLAVDKYSQATGSEVAVATTFFPDYDESHNYLFNNDTKPKSAVYGHGHLMHRIKKGLESDASNDSAEWHSVEKKNIFGGNGSMESRVPATRQTSLTHDPTARSLSSSFRTLKLDGDPSQLHSGSSGSMCSAPRKPDSNLERDPGKVHHNQPRSGKMKKTKRKKPPKLSGDFELDDNLMFGEEEHSPSCDEDDLSDDSEESEEGMPGNLPPRRKFNVRQHHPGGYSNDQFATSLPVNILAWGGQNEGGMRFRENQGPHPPAFNTQAATNSGPKIIKAENTPQLDTMMASMQALARSVTDDTALIFGDRPRPRVKLEQRQNFK